MKKLSDFPNLQLVLTKITIIDKVIQSIFYLDQEDTLIGLSIINAIENNTPVNNVFSYIKDMAIDNRQAIECIIGNDLTEQILNLN